MSDELAMERRIEDLQDELAWAKERIRFLDSILALQNHELAALRKPKFDTCTTTGNPAPAATGEGGK